MTYSERIKSPNVMTYSGLRNALSSIKLFLVLTIVTSLPLVPTNRAQNLNGGHGPLSTQPFFMGPFRPEALSSSLELRRQFEGIVRSASYRYDVDPYLVLGMIRVESNFNAYAVSHKGAKGLMQLMPGTARLHKVDNVYDPTQNIYGGVRHLRLLLNQFDGNIQLALAAYNAGAGAVAKYNSIPPYRETRNYVQRVMGYYQYYRNSEMTYLSQ